MAVYKITSEEVESAYDALNAQCEHLKQCRMNARERAQAIVVLEWPFIVLDQLRAMLRESGGTLEVEIKMPCQSTTPRTR